MSTEGEFKGLKMIFGIFVFAGILLAVGSSNKSSAIEQFSKQCLSKGTSAAGCDCLAGELDVRISVLHETPLIRHFIAPTDTELKNIVNSAVNSCH
jgi:hypothetical protein